MKGAEQLLFKSVKVSIKKEKNYFLEAEFKGEKINQIKHILNNDIKAITLHMFSLKKTEKGFTSFFVADI